LWENLVAVNVKGLYAAWIFEKLHFGLIPIVDLKYKVQNFFKSPCCGKPLLAVGT
jgi:hypothetical protein